MPDPQTTRYRHKIGGEVSGRRHEAGDPVDPATPPRRIKEWLDAKIIERDKPTRKDKPDGRPGRSSG